MFMQVCCRNGCFCESQHILTSYPELLVIQVQSVLIRRFQFKLAFLCRIGGSNINVLHPVPVSIDVEHALSICAKCVVVVASMEVLKGRVVALSPLVNGSSNESHSLTSLAAAAVSTCGRFGCTCKVQEECTQRGHQRCWPPLLWSCTFTTVL